MGNKKKELTHEEIWDDSMLIDSWNEALEEYNKYHSIYAKNGTLKDLEESEIAGSNAANAKDEDDEKPSNLIKTHDSGDEESEASEAAEDAKDKGPHETPVSVVPEPHMIMGNIRDENLKKLLMSWYYAGYYTGLYEGQQQGQVSGPS